ncbi:hypothetical protein ACLOJK_036970 [Asimina triloba]
MVASMEVAVFAETNLGTHIAVSVPPDITAGDLKILDDVMNFAIITGKLGREHYLIFPSVGEVKVKRKSCFYHLPDSLLVKNVFQKSKHCWFIKMAATRVEDVCRQAVNSTDNVHGQPATIINRIYHQEATTIVTNATARKGEQEISRSMNGTVSECSSDIISVTGILTRYFSVSDEMNVCNNEAESIRKANEEYKSEEIPMRELGENQFNNRVASAGIFVEQIDNKESRSENNMGCLFIDSDAGRSEFNVVNNINEKHQKTNMPSLVATELTHLGEGGASPFGSDRSDDNQGRRQLELEQSQCNMATKIRKYSSALAGLTSTRNQDRDTGDNIISGEGGAHHCVQDTNIQEFQSNTEAKQKEIAVPARAMTKSVDFGMKRSTATTDSGQRDFNFEISKCDVVSRTRKRHVKSKRFVSDVIGPTTVSKKGNSGLNADIADDCGAPQNHQISDAVIKSVCNLAANIHEKDHKPRVSTSITGKMSLDSEASEVVGENNIEDTGFHQDCDIKKMRHTTASSMSQQCSKTEIAVFDPTRPANIWKDGRTVASNKKPCGRHGEINEADSFNSGIGSCCSRKPDTDFGSAAKSPCVAFSLPRDQSTETPKNKLGRSEVGKRVIQAVTELGISARNQTPLISIRRSRTMAFSTGLAKHLVFEIGNDDD